MHLSITFITTDKKHKVALTQGEPGLDMVEDMRSKIKLISKLPLNKIDIVCPVFKGIYRIGDIDENQAANWKTFRARTSVPVFIPEGYLGRYLKFVPKAKYYNFRSEIYKQITGCLRPKDNATIYTEINQAELLADWANEGNPQYWGITEKEYLEVIRKHFTYESAYTWLKNKLDDANCISYWNLMRLKAHSLALIYRNDNNRYFLSEEEAEKHAEYLRSQEEQRAAANE